MSFLCLCGCEKKSEESESKLSESKLRKIIEDNNYHDVRSEGNSIDFVCEEIRDAISIGGDYFLTSNGELQRFHALKLFSNDKNCIRTEYSDANLSFIYGQYSSQGVYDTEHNLVYVLLENEVLTPEEYNTRMGSNYYFNGVLIPEDFDFISSNDCDNSEIIFIKDNKIYLYRPGNDSNQLLGEIPSDEKVLYINGTLIKTDKSYWNLEIINQDECSKYVDVKCKVSFVKSSLTEVYDEILFATGDILIDRNYHFYSDNSCFMLKDYY